MPFVSSFSIKTAQWICGFWAPISYSLHKWPFEKTVECKYPLSLQFGTTLQWLPGWSHFSNAPCIENNAKKIIHSSSVMSTHYSVTWLQRGLGLCHSPSWLQGLPTLVKTSSLHPPLSLRTLIIMGNVPIENHIKLVLTFWLCVQDPLMILCCQALLSVWVWFGVDGGWCGGSLMSLLLNQELHYSSCNLIILTDYFLDLYCVSIISNPFSESVVFCISLVCLYHASHLGKISYMYYYHIFLAVLFVNHLHLACFILLSLLNTCTCICLPVADTN